MPTCGAENPLRKLTSYPFRPLHHGLYTGQEIWVRFDMTDTFTLDVAEAVPREISSKSVGAEDALKTFSIDHVLKGRCNPHHLDKQPIVDEFKSTLESALEDIITEEYPEIGCEGCNSSDAVSILDGKLAKIDMNKDRCIER